MSASQKLYRCFSHSSRNRSASSNRAATDTSRSAIENRTASDAHGGATSLRVRRSWLRVFTIVGSCAGHCSDNSGASMSEDAASEISLTRSRMARPCHSHTSRAAGSIAIRPSKRWADS